MDAVSSMTPLPAPAMGIDTLDLTSDGVLPTPSSRPDNRSPARQRPSEQRVSSVRGPGNRSRATHLSNHLI